MRKRARIAMRLNRMSKATTGYISAGADLARTAGRLPLLKHSGYSFTLAIEIAAAAACSGVGTLLSNYVLLNNKISIDLERRLIGGFVGLCHLNPF